MWPSLSVSFSFFFNDTATTEIYTLSLHDALPILIRLLSNPLISRREVADLIRRNCVAFRPTPRDWADLRPQDRKSTRLNSSHLVISYAVFCLKKKKHETSPGRTLYGVRDIRWRLV